MRLNRRTFLQKSGLGLLTLGGFFNVTFPVDSLNQYSALAESNSRKLALLIGINQYPHGRKLQGCITDVELQKELLIYRFGFNPKNIITLTNAQATKENIENAFFEYLIDQGAKDDIVVIHFSGLGRKVQVSQPASTSDNPNNSPNIVNSLIPVDGINDSLANDLTLNTLFSLTESLPTKKVTVVLDTSYEKPAISLSKQLSIRSYLQDKIAVIDRNQLVLSKNIKDKLNNGVNFDLNSAQKSGLILSATKQGIAKEIVSGSFSAGLFTYVLTQYLWESTPPNSIMISMGEISSRIALFTSQKEKPSLDFNINQTSYPYYLFPEPKSAGEALVKTVNKDKTVNLNLVGLPLSVLFNYGVNSCFETQENIENNRVVSITELQGRQAKGIVLNPNLNIRQGDVLRESIRVLPRNLGLNIALDDKLERIEKVDATSSLSSVSQVQSVVGMSDDLIDCILAKITHNDDSVERYSLFSGAGILLDNTVGKNPNEAVSSAVRRFIPHLKNLLAAKLLHLTLNEGSSSLPITASLEIKTDQDITIINKQTFGYQQKQMFAENDSNKASIFSNNNLISNINMGSQININITNNSEQNVSFILLGINSSGKAIAYFSPENNVIMPNETLTLPQKSSSLKWILNASKGLGELVVICSYSPFNDTLMKMYESTNAKPDAEQIIPLENPVEICKTLLEDLHVGSNIDVSLVSNLSEVYALDTNNWASFDFVYQIS